MILVSANFLICEIFLKYFYSSFSESIGFVTVIIQQLYTLSILDHHLFSIFSVIKTNLDQLII
jgi:hypothetical protein